LKEVDRTADGVPCLRLTDAGHELIELVRDESRWRQAKWACRERTGGLALAVVRGILLEWALEPAPRYRPRRLRPSEASRWWDWPRYNAPPSAEIESPWEDDYDDPEERVHYVRVQPRFRNAWRRRRPRLNGDRTVVAREPSLPEYLI
jgi:hypothetical protein